MNKNKYTKIILSALILLLPFTSSQIAMAKEYVVDYDNSKIEFSGTHADMPFKGRFEEWAVQISFDPANLSTSKLIATFNTASAKTGNAIYDGTLPQKDWFDVKKHPQANFIGTSITAKEDGHYNAQGKLTIRGITNPVSFDFTLSDLDKSPVKLDGTLTINRLDFDIGKGSDASAEWVGREITIKIDVWSTPAN